LGWLADRALGTTPWLFAIGALAGFAAGLYLVWLRAQRMDAREQAVRDGDGG
ncbi:MAG: AtpZ/AtpI family protein, partial [Actinobacteria bacterium]|nr:AtpZ/AtpI family protein [Actinomycetota bacterium]